MWEIQRAQLFVAHLFLVFFYFILVTAIGGRSKSEILLLAGAVGVNALAQVALRRFTQWLWIEHATFQLRDKRFVAWTSEGFFPGGVKVVKFVFYPSKSKKQPFFANNFKIQGLLPRFPTPILCCRPIAAHFCFSLSPSLTAKVTPKTHSQQWWFP